ncbi:hypothetical protein [Sandaracinus amylolyticus]|uniref:Uncharacterized protein n=1 Tax=Sandaracinus amylolyticus TaxID=927083 RepID=A0A0F6W5E8_9BACT|nr:hypothetical protein [Sandaracinus amylolyticus]AKF07758.1 hypothetical protein DB32_004907 [Sandaracinus amylolyticus]
MSAEKTLGDAIVERLGGVPLDARAKGAARAFTAQHKRFAAAEDVSDAKASARSAALTTLGAIDEALDAAVSRLADKLVGEGITKRNAPFAGLSRHSPSELVELGYGNEVREAIALTKAVRKKKPPREVIVACDAVDRLAAKVKSQLPAYDRAHKAWKVAIAERDALLPEWQKSLSRLRVLAKASLIDRPGAYDALVAPPEPIAAPRPRQRKMPPARPVPGEPEEEKSGS